MTINGVAHRLKPADPVSCYTHAAGAVLAVIGTVYLLVRTQGNTAAFLSFLVYGCSVVFLFSASAAYHAMSASDDDRSLLRRLDHTAIFFMIAGSYTPPCYRYLDGAWFVGIVGAQWALVFLGVFFKLFYLSAPRLLSTAIYVLMGWLALIPFKQLLLAMPLMQLSLYIAGGIAFTAGAVIYAMKKPNPVPGFFGFHELFHLFILAGAGLQYGAMLLLWP